jgi:hypothetical protein
MLPIHGARVRSEGDASGWFIWAGEWSDAPDCFVALPVDHWKEWCPSAVSCLLLPPGWSFQVATNHADVWFESDAKPGSSGSVPSCGISADDRRGRVMTVGSDWTGSRGIFGGRRAIAERGAFQANRREAVENCSESPTTSCADRSCAEARLDIFLETSLRARSVGWWTSGALSQLRSGPVEWCAVSLRLRRTGAGKSWRFPSGLAATSGGAGGAGIVLTAAGSAGGFCESRANLRRLRRV